MPESSCSSNDSFPIPERGTTTVSVAAGAASFPGRGSQRRILVAGVEVSHGRETLGISSVPKTSSLLGKRVLVLKGAGHTDFCPAHNPAGNGGNPVSPAPI